MQVIEKCFKLIDLLAHCQHQNLHPPEEFLADLQLFRQKIHT